VGVISASYRKSVASSSAIPCCLRKPFWCRASAHEPRQSPQHREPGGDCAADAGEHNVQLGWMAGRRAFLAVEQNTQAAVGDERDAVIGLASIEPRLYGRSDVNNNVVVYVRLG